MSNYRSVRPLQKKWQIFVESPEIERLKRRLAALLEVTMTSQEKEAAKRNKFQGQRKMLIQTFETIRQVCFVGLLTLSTTGAFLFRGSSWCLIGHSRP